MTLEEPVRTDSLPAHTPALQLVAGLSPEEVQHRLRDANRATDLGHRMLAFYLHEMQERRLHQLSGHSSAVHYATARLGMSRRRARQLVAAGRELTELSEVDTAFCRGDLSWSKVRLLTEVAVPGTQSRWIERASEICCRELEHEVRTTERGRPPRREDRLGLPVVRFVVKASLDALGQAQWEKARQRLQDELGRPVTDAELLANLAESFLKGEGSAGHSSYQVMVKQCPDCEGAAVETEEGSVPADRTTAAMVACDGERVGLDRDIDQPTPRWLRRGVLARDGGRCRSCRSTQRLMVHHVHFRSRGGRSTADNLVTLCAHCHSLVHEGLLRIEGEDQRRLSFVNRQGQGLECEPAPGTVLEVAGGPRGPRTCDPVPDEVDAAWWRANEDRLVWKPRTRRFALRPEPASPG